ncbi:unnamed protein product, partial [Polarella glacialis]
ASGVDAFGEVDAVGASSGSQSLSFFEARQAPGDTLLVPPGWWQQELHEAGPTISVVSQLLNEQAFLEMTAGLLRAAGAPAIPSTGNFRADARRVAGVLAGRRIERPDRRATLASTQ